MQKFFKILTVSAALVLLTFGTAMAVEAQFEPLSPRYLEWLEQHQNNSSSPRLMKSGAVQTQSNGYIPFHIDLSHLAKNPPVENSGSNTKRLTKSTQIPTKYDLRNVNGKNYLTSVKNQSPYGTCWAHAAIGAIESNLLKQSLGTYDLSEMHLAWFAFRNSDKSKAFHNLNSSSFTDVMDHGGNAFYPAALFARLAGPVNEATLPYSTTQPSKATPESYTMAGVRLREVYYLAFDDVNVNSSTQRNIVKQRIMDNGSVLASYCDNQSNNKENYNKTSNGTAYYYNSSSVNHAVQIVGWDDNFSRNNFKTKPSVDGAWLIKNSWGTSFGDSGYFWMSYAQYLTDGTAFVAEKLDSSMKVYDYSPLGWCGTWPGSATGSSVHSANVFRSERDNEQLTEVGFYTPDNNVSYQIKVYTGMTSMPSSTPVNGSPVSTTSGTIAYAGWHTVTLSTPVNLTKNQYFSVVVSFSNCSKTAVETVNQYFAPNVSVGTGSFFSTNGTSWQTGQATKADATIKAYTITLSTNPAETELTIITTSLPSGHVGQSYSQALSASGSTPITWSVSSGSLPTGLTLSSAGVLSGTPTAAGSFTFTVKATNSYGNDSRSYTVSIAASSTPGQDVNLTGYVGYTLTHQLTPAGTWTKTSGSLPAGISLSRSGLLSGRPSSAGSYSATLSCTTTTTTSKSSANTKSSIVTVKVNFTINAKPTKPTIRTSSLAVGVVGTAYSQAITATGTAPIVLSVTGLPAGLSFNQSTGYITGTPTTPGTSTVTIKAENLATILDRSTVTRSLRLTIKARPPVIANPGTLPYGIVGTAYSSVQFKVSEGTAPITWSASGLPSGLRMSSSGLLSGTPTRAGTFTMTVKASNAGGNTTRSVQMKIIEKPTVSSARMTNATTDKSYTARFTAKGTTPITWEFTGLPDTMSFTQNSTGTTATVTGIPTTPGTFSVKMKLTNAAGSTSYTVTFTINGVAPRLTASLCSARVGQSYTGSRILATGTKPMNISYSIAASDLSRFGISGLGDLGLKFTSDSAAGTAAITGTPTISIRSLPITFTARNSVSTATNRVMLTIVGDRPVFTSPSESTVNRTTKINSAVTVNFTVKGSKKITYSMNSVSGFTLRQTGDYTAVLTGTAPNRDATTTITVTAANADGKATKNVVIKTQTPPTITTTSLAAGTLNKNYSAKVSATGTKTIRFELSGSLPAGVRFSNGSFSGKPTVAGSFTFTVKATNSIGSTSKKFTLSVTDPNAKSSSKSMTTNSNTLKPTVTFGKTNTLSRGTEAQLEAKGYLIAAVLPEISVNVSGMYDIDVELYGDVPDGAELVWLAFPEKGRESDDDEIAEFYDVEGKEITLVPENHQITVAPWLNKGVKYSPVIAVR